MKSAWIAFIVGALFSIGLGLAGMTQPQKIIAFLDVFGKWDPSLLLVIGGGVAFHFMTYRLIRKRHHPLFDKKWHVPTKKDITPALVIGSTIFGIGWGLGGFCPGPAITSLATFGTRPIVFVASMIIGMGLFRLFDKKAKLNK